MATEERLPLWQHTLGVDEPHGEHVQRLRTSYRLARGRATVLAAKIAVDLPDFTVHDERHLQALWEIADQLVGNEDTNPLEGYVLGIALLIHDLGMAVAAYPDGLDELRSDP